jgi:GGDEF domain-containing protein
VLTYVSKIDIQLKTAVDFFTESIEDDCNKIFYDEDIMDYDPIVNDYPGYESSTLKNEVKNRMLKINPNNNYNDFMIIFSDGSSVGKVSSGGSDIITEFGFDGLNEYVKDGGDAWVHSLTGNNRKFYYIRRISDHSLFMLSMYADELCSVFTFGNGDETSSSYLVNEDGTIIYTGTGDLSPGDKLPDEIAKLFDSKDGDSVIGSEYIAASLVTNSGWQAVTAAPTPTLIEISPLAATAASMLFTVIVAIAVCTGFIACRKYSLSMISDPNGEFIDPLTGTLNQYGLDEKISELMETSIVGSTYAFILIGIKDARQIKNSVSPRYWNNIRMKTIECTENFFSDRKYIVGRVSEDYIALFADYSEFDIFKAHEALKEGCNRFCKSFDDFSVGNDNELLLHVSIGVCIYPDHAEDFDDLLEKANEALKIAEQSDKNSFVIYDPAKAVKK